ncbi:hypothetical protein BBR47_06730 [Brevibacillus brevis NBRC 100599]|uniref:Uncharacterized protein n=1 Tax=Brevibacillus brevis (strain 47 / JCM 6285 / NBRC 100599) TaxID=358681 RepID=C0Z4C3_BREBN|nr:hypothetical protein BBR47_06730 [Brevibacillus brevis NBRC 100599]
MSLSLNQREEELSMKIQAKKVESVRTTAVAA